MTTHKRSATERGAAVKSLETAFRILDALEASNGAGVSEVADEAGVAKSTVHDHLTTLESNGFLVKNDDDTYRVGLRFLDHGGRARSRLQLYQTAKSEIEKLADKTGELVNLVVEEDGLGVYIDYAKGQDAVHLDTYLGKHEHLHNTAFGKAILAHLPSSEVNEIIERHGLPAETGRTITSREVLEEHLDTVRENGYAVDNEERLAGTRCVAAPIKTHKNEVTGAISISGPSGRLKNDDLIIELANEVTNTANIVEVNMTYG